MYRPKLSQCDLTRYSDYSFRVLAHLALEPERLFSISKIARTYGISQNHLVKVVHALARNGFVKTVRGRTGGVMLARPTGEIRVGAWRRCSKCSIHAPSPT